MSYGLFPRSVGAGRWALGASFAALGLSLAGCPTPESTKKQAREPRVEDEWAGIQRTAEWLHATRDFSGPRKAECEEVLGWVKGEKNCKGSLCAHGRDLAKEWGERCSKMLPDEADEVKDLRAEYGRKVKDETECGKQADVMLREGCGKEDKTCEKTAQAWGTRCGKAEGTPLVVRMLERTVERKLPEPKRVSLDIRSCDDLRAEVAKGASCAQRFACEEAHKVAQTFQERCTGNDLPPPPLATAIFELAIARGAGMPAKAVPASDSTGKLSPAELPTALADGSGAALFVCEQRTPDLASYLAQRKACEGGAVVLARASKGEGGLEARVVVLPHASDGAFARRLPDLLVAGEAEARDAEAEKAVGAALDEALSRPAPEAMKAAVKVLFSSAPLIARSAKVRAALQARDEKLAAAAREIGRGKLAASRGKLARLDLDAMLERARTRLFADVTADGAVEPGAPSQLGRLDTRSFLPKATAASQEPIAALLKRKRPPVARSTEQQARAYGLEMAGQCGAARKARKAASEQLLACALGPSGCDEAKAEQLGKSIDEAIEKEAGARHQLDLVSTGPGFGAKGELEQAATEAGCPAEGR